MEALDLLLQLLDASISLGDGDFALSKDLFFLLDAFACFGQVTLQSLYLHLQDLDL